MAIGQGTRFGRYEIRTLLGRGGMGEVYLAQDPSLHRTAAIKVLHASFATDRDRLQRFKREALAVSSLNHPNILTIYEIGQQDEYHFIATEFIDGQSLSHHIERTSLKLMEILEIGIQVASALSAAHEAGIVHRDIKPDNIMLRHDRLVKVLDFGIAKLNDPVTEDLDSEALTQSIYTTNPGMVMGTPPYMSPEQVRGLSVDERTDIWSLGVVLYKMVTGSLPFTGGTSSDVMVAILSIQPRSLTLQAANVPDELERIVMKALSKEQAERYQAVRELEADLKALKQRMEFEAELERSGARALKVSGSQPKADGTAQLEEKATGSAASHIHTSPVAMYVDKVRQHKRAALITVAIIILATAAFVVYGLFIAGSGEASITSLAVLPFKNLSNDVEKEYLSDGISESLINRLSQLPGLKVIANSSSARYKDHPVDPQEIARALSITNILTGKISQHGDSLSISVELIDARDGTQVWGEQYVRKAADLLSVQADISREITNKLRLHLTAGQQQQADRRETVNPEAYELLLKGRFHRSKGRTEDRKKAADYFNQAIAVDPDYALPYAELSDIYRSLVGSGILDPKEYLLKAEEAALKAIELDEGLADAHYTLANLKTYAWQWADADREYKRAIELNPNLALAHRWYASYLRLLSRHEQAIDEIKRARELDPLSTGVNATVGYIYFSARQYDQSIQVLNTTLELDGGYPYTHLFLGFNYAATGMYEKAITSYQKAIDLGLDTPSTQINLGAAYAGAGDVERARALLKRLETGREHVSPGDLALLYAALGEREEAFASLEKAYDERDSQLQYLGVSPGFDPLRSDPRFQSLLRRVGLMN